MIKTIFKEITILLQNAISEKGHPFRCCTVATIGTGQAPEQRTMVLREVTDSLNLFFYTDSRSLKINQLQSNSSISLLFYDPKNKIQLTIKGEAKILDTQATINRWNLVGEHTKKDYCTIIAPGSPITDSNEITYDFERPNFAVIKIIPSNFEYLRLGQPNHTKAQFALEDNQWKGTYLVP